LDQTIEVRSAAAIRLYKHILGAKGADGPRLGERRQKRFVLAVRALDGWQDGASYRSVATTLFGSSRLRAEPWKTASIRGSTIRLVRIGRDMMVGGYFDLLRR